jgi:hypothetical protein
MGDGKRNVIRSSSSGTNLLATEHDPSFVYYAVIKARSLVSKSISIIVSDDLWNKNMSDA